MVEKEILKVEGFSKSYGRVTAVENISLSVDAGEIYGIIGPDGAGKTTLFRMLATLLIPDSGKASLLGLDVVKDYAKVRKTIGYMPGKFSLYQDLSIEENLKFFATIYHTTLSESYDYIAPIYKQIEPFKKRRAGKLSGGMKQKLALCCALVHKPQILILDEPTTGVDPVSRKEFWQMLDLLRCQGLSVLVSTPYMDEAVLCNHIALMQQGKFLMVDTPTNVQKSYPKKLYSVSGCNIYQLLLDIRQCHDVDSAFSFGETIHVTFFSETPDVLYQFLESKGYEHLKIKEILPEVEDCFMLLSSKKENLTKETK